MIIIAPSYSHRALLFVAFVLAQPVPTDTATLPLTPAPDEPCQLGVAVFMKLLPEPAENPADAYDSGSD